MTIDRRSSFVNRASFVRASEAHFKTSKPDDPAYTLAQSGEVPRSTEAGTEVVDGTTTVQFDNDREETFDVSAGTDLLQTMVDDDGIVSRQDLAEIWNVCRRSINYKIAGRSPVSIEEWNLLFREIFDLRIPHLLFARTDYIAFKTPPAAVQLRPGVAAVHDSLAHIIEQSSAWQTRMCEVLRDGKVDDRDAELIEDMTRRLPELMCTLKTAQALIERMYTQRTGSAAGNANGALKISGGSQA